ncbi:hypothetical protein ACLB9X_03055 [Streptomyces sp. 5K101]|uniref:hypothetical protein n=1 Tax=Streptomyces sp. 5K101 TaxID=3390037 RepID=UPI003975F471
MSVYAVVLAVLAIAVAVAVIIAVLAAATAGFLARRERAHPRQRPSAGRALLLQPP